MYNQRKVFFKYQYTVAPFFFTIYLLNVFKNVKWMGVCCLTPDHFYSSYIVGRTIYFSMRWWCPLCTWQTKLDFNSANSLEYSTRTHMSLHWTHYSDYESTSLCLYSFTLCANINFIVFGLTRSWIEYSNYYTTGALLLVITKRLISLEYIYTFCICKTENALSTDK